MDILGVGQSLLQQTYNRFLRDFLPENIYIVTNQAYVDLVKYQIAGINGQQILAEPMGKNTAACIAYACGKISKINTHAVCIVAPSDHLILQEDRFLVLSARRAMVTYLTVVNRVIVQTIQDNPP